MKKLGVVITFGGPREQDDLSPDFPLHAFAYSRNGHVRLAGLGRLRREGRAGK